MMRILAACVWLVFLLAVFAQAAGELEITAEPHHHLVFENQYVRVFKVEVPPHQATLMHWHRHDYVYVNFGPTVLENDVEGKPPATLKPQDGQTAFSPGPFAHLVKAVADTPFRNVTIELLKDKQSPKASWEDERGLNILPGGTEDILFVKDGVRVADVQLQPGALIPQHKHRGPYLLVAVSELELRTSPAGKTSKPVEMKPEDVKWFPVGPPHTLMNLGKQTAHFITLEF